MASVLSIAPRGAADPLSSNGIIWSTVSSCAASTRSSPCSESARFRFRKLEICAWLNEATPEQHDRPNRLGEGEDQSPRRRPLLSCEQKPEVLRFAGGTDADLRIQWQEFLLMMIASAFELPQIGRAHV